MGFLSVLTWAKRSISSSVIVRERDARNPMAGSGARSLEGLLIALVQLCGNSVTIGAQLLIIERCDIANGLTHFSGPDNAAHNFAGASFGQACHKFKLVWCSQWAN